MIDQTPYRRSNPWQFSVASLLALMTFIGVGLALFRPYPNLSIAFFMAASLILLAADYFSRRATRQNWRTLTRFVWAIAVAFLFTIGVAVAYVVSQSAGVFWNG